MKLLVDTNIFLEILLDQEKAEEAKSLLRSTDHHEFFTTDFTIHSIGLKLFQGGRHTVFLSFLRDMVATGVLQVLWLAAPELQRVVELGQTSGLDFDDAYQCAAAEKHDLTVVSFDDDFDHTDRGRKTPADVLGG